MGGKTTSRTAKNILKPCQQTSLDISFVLRFRKLTYYNTYFSYTYLPYTYIQVPGQTTYSGGSKTELGKPNAIPISNVLKFGFRMVPTIRKPKFLPFKNRTYKMAALGSVVLN